MTRMSVLSAALDLQDWNLLLLGNGQNVSQGGILTVKDEEGGELWEVIWTSCGSQLNPGSMRRRQRPGETLCPLPLAVLMPQPFKTSSVESLREKP